jgi:hypothetical protein
MVIFLLGAAVGQVLTTLAAGYNPGIASNKLIRLIIHVFIVFFVLLSIWHKGEGFSLTYLSRSRWSGPWDNPNTFGLLTGAGTILMMGTIVQSPKSKGQITPTSEPGTPTAELWRRAKAVLFLVALLFMARGILHSYSRGSWIATLFGLGYLVWRIVQNPQSEIQSDLSKERMVQSPEFLLYTCISRLKENWLLFCVILFSMLALVFWQFRQTDWPPARRTFSSVNADDFAWRNRVTTWEGAFQITAEHPWFGAGWNKPELLFDHYFVPPKLTESAAIEMNDYLMFGATVGIPALFCFGMYIWLSLVGGVKAENRRQNEERGIAESDWLKVVCRSGVIVLLVGFWFDGGLFKLPTASTFWILLELGAA